MKDRGKGKRWEEGKEEVLRGRGRKERGNKRGKEERKKESIEKERMKKGREVN